MRFTYVIKLAPVSSKVHGVCYRQVISEPSSVPTLRVVVEDAVVGAGVRVRVPETLPAAAERRKLHLLLLQLLLHLSPESLNEPTDTNAVSDHTENSQHATCIRHVSAFTFT